MAKKFLDVNKNIIHAIFMIDGNEEEIDKQLDAILETEGKTVKKTKTKAQKAKDKIVENAEATPGRRIKRKLFRNR